MTNELTIIFRWWFIFFATGVISLPVTYFIFKKFIDLGYAFSKTVGFLVITYTFLVLNILRLAPFTTDAIYLISFAYFLFNAYLGYKLRKKIYPQFLSNLKTIAISEILFTLGLITWSLIHGYQPDINGLEKFMDFGFINSILNTRYLPPADMWFAGSSINYYWFGHLYVAVATKLSSIPSAITFNLMLATILGLTLTSTFSIVATLVKKAIKIDKRVALAAGLISALLVTFAGNFHAPIYILKDGAQNYWYPNATRFIGYHPETNDKTIHEFPIYSFVVSDLHAHLINLPFVLLYIALLGNYVIGKWPPAQRASRLGKKFEFGVLNFFGIWNLEFGTSLKLIPLGSVLGLMFMTSSWDFGNYALVTGIIFTLFAIKKRGINFEAIWNVGKLLAIILLISFLTALPFLLNFESLVEGIRVVTNRTPLWQLGVLWGFPAILTATFAVLVYKLRQSLKNADLFVGGLLVSSWILIAIPEIIFVKDIYIASHQRANTMFKLTYQAYVMTYLSGGYIAVRVLSYAKGLARSMLFIIFLILFAAVLTYPSFAINSYYGELKNYQGLSGETWLAKRYPEIYDAVLWLRGNIEGQPVILEAPGDSYTDFNVISSYTGLPTVSGWYVHEWLWRGGASFPQKRVEDITQIYTSSDIRLTKLLLEKYNVEYVIVGTFEHQKYPNLNEQKFRELGKEVFSSGNTKIYQLQ